MTDSSPLEFHAVIQAAIAAAPAAAIAGIKRAEWLDAVASAVEAERTDLVTLANEETHLGIARLDGELSRTTAQLRLFADVVRDRAYLELAVDHADFGPVPPRPELRRMLVPVGPVAVYAASNFPFAFSVLGGDTASALATGCPVIVKAHPGHPRLSAAVTVLAQSAFAKAGAPAGLLQTVYGFDVGRELVTTRAVRAAAFTGSLTGGRALFDLANGRPDPIPFYGELGSINPVVIMPKAAQRNEGNLASGLIESFTLGIGQFCTKPGLVFVPEVSPFSLAVATRLADRQGGRMLTEGLAQSYEHGRESLANHPDVTTLVPGSIAGDTVRPALFSTTASALAADPNRLTAEVFGPTTLLVSYGTEEELYTALDTIDGSLTTTIHAMPDEDATALAAFVAARSGRVLFAGWPTGVAVTWSQQHGGPWPATTSLFTSVGASSTRRFQRPVTWQDAPESLLPVELRDSELVGAPVRIDGTLHIPVREQ